MKRSQHPSHVYRERMRTGLRLCMEPGHAGMLKPDETIANLRLGDLEALYALVFEADPRIHAPPYYRPAETRR